MYEPTCIVTNTCNSADSIVLHEYCIVSILVLQRASQQRISFTRERWHLAVMLSKRLKRTHAVVKAKESGPIKVEIYEFPPL